MASSNKKNVIELDGRTGEGGGQVVRIAVGLSALTGIPIRITSVRGNRAGGRGGGLKAQHASSLKWLAEATNAKVTGCFIGSKEFEFTPLIGPTRLSTRNIKINSNSAASILLVFQAIFPFLLFAGDESNSPITLNIVGGTNVSFSLSFDYLDQVLLPTLERLGVPRVERNIVFSRGWSHGSQQIGEVEFKFTPLRPGQALEAASWPEFQNPGAILKIDITMVVPAELLVELKKSLLFELNLVFPGVEVNVVTEEDSRHQARMYTLLVAHTANGFRLGRDWLYDRSSRKKSKDEIATEIAQKVVDELDTEIRRGGCVDEYLQDQLVIFQAIANGRSLISETSDNTDYDLSYFAPNCGVDEAGSMHTKTARWVTSQLLPNIRWSQNGRVCEGIACTMESLSSLENKMASLNISSL